jgi:MFS family permease
MMALPMAMVRDAAPGGKIGRVMGLLGAASAAGTALGPALGGLLLAAAGWRALFLLCAAGGAAAMLLAWRALPAGPAPRCAATGEGLKAGPMVLLAATLACYALAASLGAGRFEAANLVLLAVAVAGVATFFRSERRSAAPLLGAELLRDAPLVRSLAAGALVAAVVMATLVVGPFYLAYGLDQNAAEIGVLLSAGPVVVALIGVPAGRLTDRHGARPVGLGGLALMLAGCGGLRLLPAAAGVPGYLLCITVTTGGYALFQTANNSFVLGRSPEERRGAAAGLLNLSRNLGFITGASAMASAFAAGLGGAEPSQAAPEAVAAAMRTTFALAAALILLALCLLGPKARGAKAG